MKKLLISFIMFLFIGCSTSSNTAVLAPLWTHTINYNRIMTNDFFEGDLCLEIYTSLYYEFPEIKLTLSQWMHGYCEARRNKINPLLAPIMWQKEQSLLFGDKSNIRLAMGYNVNNKKDYGFNTQTAKGLMCLRNHYDRAKANGYKSARLQLDSGEYIGSVTNLTNAEYAHYRYNPVPQGNWAFRSIRIQYQKLVKKIYQQRLILLGSIDG